MSGNWKRITFDPREHPDGYTYHCAHGHRWFLSFREQDAININEGAKNCPECGDGDSIAEEHA